MQTLDPQYRMELEVVYEALESGMASSEIGAKVFLTYCNTQLAFRWKLYEAQTLRCTVA
jgi:hypothetical protein